MFSFASNISSPFTAFWRGAESKRDDEMRIRVESVPIHNVEESDDKTSQTLKHLLKLNHQNFSILFHNNQFHNHLPHILGSAFLIGADSERLRKIYAEDSTSYESWKDSPGEISAHDWRDYLGDGRYTRAYLDFFEDQLVLKGYRWLDVVEEYLHAGPEPLFNSLISGLAHPLIHLGYAYELSSRDLAMEALAMAACCYNPLHQYLDDPKYTKPSPLKGSSPLELLQRLHQDERLDGVFTQADPYNTETVLKDHKAILLEYWNALHISNPTTQFADSQLAATAIVVATHRRDIADQKFDFFMIHLLTSSHASRVLLPLIPSRYHIPLFRQWWLLTLLTYISQLRPQINMESVLKVDLQDRDWAWVDKQALEGKYATDEHYVKGLRAMKEAARTWGDKDQFQLKAAVRLAVEFDGWGGFGSAEVEA